MTFKQFLLESDNISAGRDLQFYCIAHTGYFTFDKIEDDDEYKVLFHEHAVYMDHGYRPPMFKNYSQKYTMKDLSSLKSIKTDKPVPAIQIALSYELLYFIINTSGKNYKVFEYKTGYPRTISFKDLNKTIKIDKTVDFEGVKIPRIYDLHEVLEQMSDIKEIKNRYL